MNKKKGLTLLEILVVLTLMLVLSSISLPKFREILKNMHLRNAASTLYGDLMFARVKAIEKKLPCGILFNLDANNYNVFCDNDNSGNYTDGDEILKNINIDDDYDGVIIESTTNNPFLFGKRGFPQTLGNGKIILKMGNKSAQLIISSLGRIRVEFI